MSSMFKDARGSWAMITESIADYEGGTICRKDMIETFNAQFSTISTLLDNEVNFDEKPENEKV